MPNYRRNYVQGGTFFFTVVTRDRTPFLCHPTARAILKEKLAIARRRWPFQLDAIVLLPDHLHTIWTVSMEDPDYSRRWGWIKKECTKVWREMRTPPLFCDTIWQPRFWEHTIRDERDYEDHSNYLHFNPVKHGLVRAPADWPHSTFRRWVQLRRYDADWGCATYLEQNGEFDFSRLRVIEMEPA